MWGKAVGLIGFQIPRRGDEIDRFVELEYRRESVNRREDIKMEIRQGLTSDDVLTK